MVESFAHACWYDFSLHACLDTYGSVYVRAITITPNNSVCVCVCVREVVEVAVECETSVVR